jgi:hypothetical protein
MARRVLELLRHHPRLRSRDAGEIVTVACHSEAIGVRAVLQRAGLLATASVHLLSCRRLSAPDRGVQAFPPLPSSTALACASLYSCS